MMLIAVYDQLDQIGWNQADIIGLWFSAGHGANQMIKYKAVLS